MFEEKKALLLDMNGTFMFGEDRFGALEDFSEYYIEHGGVLLRAEINKVIRTVYDYLETRYQDAQYRHVFPSLEKAIGEVLTVELPPDEVSKIMAVFAHHECGHIPDEYIEALYKLSTSFSLGLVADIWAPKQDWVEVFERSGIDRLFSALSFSSDLGMVKPSPVPFERVMRQLNFSKHECLVIGDSPIRDLGGARAAGIDCVLVGGANHAFALAGYPSLLAFSEAIEKCR